jgi:flagellar hook-length control protein FliK
VVTFDSTPPATPAAATIGLPSAGGAPKDRVEAFADLLSLLGGVPSNQAQKSDRPGAGVNRDLPAGMPFAFAASLPASNVPSTAANADRASRVKAGSTDAPDAAVGVDHDDEKALAENMKWLLAMAITTNVDAPKDSSSFAGDAAADQASGSACSKTAAPDSQTPPALSADISKLTGVLPRAVPPVGPAADAAGTQSAEGAAPPGVQPRPAPQTAAKIVPQTSPAPAGTHDAPAASLPADAAAPASANAVPAPQSAPARDAASAAPASVDATKPAAAAAMPAIVPVAAPETRFGDAGSSSKQGSRGSDERRVEASTVKAAATASIQTVFQMPAEVHAPSAVAPASDVVPASRPDAAEIELPRQIVQAIRMQWNDGIGDARIKLQPEYLGELSIAIRVEHGAVTAALETSSASVREWIDNNQPMLRQALAEHGLHLDRLTVTEEQAQPDWSGGEHEKQRQQQDEAKQAERARQRADADASTFELVV